MDGVEEDEGIYSCVWNNSAGVTYRNFTVKYTKEVIIETEVIIGAAVTVVLLFIGLFAIGIKLYLDKVIYQPIKSFI